MKPCPRCRKKDLTITLLEYTVRVLEEKVKRKRVAIGVFAKDNKRLREEKP